MYSPGRVRPASSPSSTVIERASYDKWNSILLNRARETLPVVPVGARTPYSSWEFGMTRAFLAVRVAVSPATWDAPPAALTWPGRPAHFDPFYGAFTELGIEPAAQHGREQSDLSGPRSRVGRDHQLTLGETVRASVRSQVRPDYFLPITTHRTDGCLFLPALVRQQSADVFAQRLRVIAADPPARPGAASVGCG